MPKPGSKNRVSPETRDEATRIARATQRPGQTKEQTRLIAQGIQKGIDQYKKQQKAKARELDKRLKKVRSPQADQDDPATAGEAMPEPSAANARLPWILLLLSWAGFGLYLALFN